VAHVDVVLLDEHMQSSGGVLKGSEAIAHFRRLAQEHGFPQPVLVINSGNCSAVDHEHYREMGADAVWPKPYPSCEQIVRDVSVWIHTALLRSSRSDRPGPGQL
jgi:CheY-like chemotaxis protein